MKKIIFAIAVLATGFASAQVGVGNTDPKATLDITGTPASATTADGLLIPRLTGDQLAAKDAVYLAEQTGAQVYVTAAATTPAGKTAQVTTPGFYFYNGTVWTLLSDASKFVNNPTQTSIDLEFLSDGVTPRNTNNNISFTDAGILTLGSGNSTYSQLTRNTIEFHGDNASPLFSGLAFGGTNNFIPTTQYNAGRARGTSAAPTSVQAGDFLNTFSSANYGVNGWHFNSAQIRLRQESTPTATSNPTQISFQTTSNNSLTSSEKMIILADGNVGIGTNTPNASAQLDLSTTTRGFLPPRMTASQMNLISSPAEGLVVYCTNCIPTKGLRVFDGVSWVNMQGNPTPAAAFTFTGNFYHMPNFYAGKVMGADNLLYIEVNVTSVGEINFSSPTVNGYAFSFIAQAATTGIQYIALLPAGTQTAFDAAGDTFTITGEGATTETQNLTITHSQLGSELTAFSNGTENFSDNTTCQTRVISTTTAGNCPATVTVGLNTYNTVFINGQCWFKENLAEAPTAPCADAINSGCNTWLNTASADLGKWGYYNNTTINGTDGWRTTVPAANEGLIYQWSAAMKGSTAERAQGICPAGWHIPSDCEWKYLEHGLGMTIADQNAFNIWRNSGNVGAQLSTLSRLTPASANGTGSNTTGFTALMQGQRVSTTGAFQGRGTRSSMWSSTPSGSTNVVTRFIGNDQAGVAPSIQNRNSAHAVRCLKD
jgi:uncharacterized protein (TIGR02145 family)